MHMKAVARKLKKIMIVEKEEIKSISSKTKVENEMF